LGVLGVDIEINDFREKGGKTPMEKCGPARVSVVFFGGQWVVQIVEQGQLKKREFEREQDARDFAEGHQLR
jgi:hypothetical protein